MLKIKDNSETDYGYTCLLNIGNNEKIQIRREVYNWLFKKTPNRKTTLHLQFWNLCQSYIIESRYTRFPGQSINIRLDMLYINTMFMDNNESIWLGRKLNSQ